MVKMFKVGDWVRFSPEGLLLHGDFFRDFVGIVENVRPKMTNGCTCPGCQAVNPNELQADVRFVNGAGGPALLKMTLLELANVQGR